MNSKLLISLAIIASLVGAFLLLNKGDQPQETTIINNISTTDMSQVVADLSNEIKTAISKQTMDNVTILDVRTDQEWNQSHATSATHWGLVEHLSKGELPPIDKDNEIYVYCRSGNRARQAIKILQEAGYTNLKNIRGLSDWIAAGGQVTSGLDGDDQPAEQSMLKTLKIFTINV